MSRPISPISHFPKNCLQASLYFFPRLASRKSTCFRTAMLSACVPSSSAMTPIVARSAACPLNSDTVVYALWRACACVAEQCSCVWIRVRRTDGIVFKHAQRLMRAGPLHCAVVTSHGHRDEAHHNGTGFRCACLISIVLVSRKARRRSCVGRNLLFPRMHGYFLFLRIQKGDCLPFLAIATCDCVDAGDDRRDGHL